MSITEGWNPLPTELSLVVIMDVAVFVHYGMSSCLKFKPMGLGSIHSCADLGKIIITDRDGSSC